jgi:hypothetical protein
MFYPLPVEHTELGARAHIPRGRMYLKCNRTILRLLHYPLVAHAGLMLFPISHEVGINFRAEDRRELRCRPKLLGARVGRLLLAQYRFGFGRAHAWRSLLPLELFDAILQKIEGRLEFVDTRLEIRGLRQWRCRIRRQGDGNDRGRYFHTGFIPGEKRERIMAAPCGLHTEPGEVGPITLSCHLSTCAAWG